MELVCPAVPWRLFGCHCLNGWSTVCFISYADVWRCSSVNKFGKLGRTAIFLFGIPPYLIAQLTPSILLPIHSLWRSRLTTWALHRCCILIDVKYKDVNLLIHNKFFTAIHLTSIKSLGFFVLCWLGFFFFGSLFVCFVFLRKLLNQLFCASRLLLCLRDHHVCEIMFSYVLPARTRQIPNLLLKEDAFRNSMSLSAVLANPVCVGPCSFPFYSPGLHCLQGLGIWGSGLLLLFLYFPISGHGVLSRKENCLHRWLFTYVFPKVCSLFRQWSPWLCRQISSSRPSCTESHLITEILYGCGIQGNRLHS